MNLLQQGIGADFLRAYLSNVCVAKELHRNGLGYALVAKSKMVAQEWGKKLYCTNLLLLSTLSFLVVTELIQKLVVCTVAIILMALWSILGHKYSLSLSHTHTHMCTRLHTHTRTCAHTYVCMCARTHTQAHMHTHEFQKETIERSFQMKYQMKLALQLSLGNPIPKHFG